MGLKIVNCRCMKQLKVPAVLYEQVSAKFCSFLLFFWEHPFILIVEMRDQGEKRNTGSLLLLAKVVGVHLFEPQYLFHEPQLDCVCDFFFVGVANIVNIRLVIFWTGKRKSGVTTQRAVEVVSKQHNNTWATHTSSSLVFFLFFLTFLLFLAFFFTFVTCDADYFCLFSF